VQVLVPAAAGLCPPQVPAATAPAAPAAPITPCLDGGLHDFEIRLLRNDATNRNGGLNASPPVGIGAGVNAQSEHDHGERMVSICKKCGKTVGDLGALVNQICCVVT
jgi:hypothetical protein